MKKLCPRGYWFSPSILLPLLTVLLLVGGCNKTEPTSETTSAKGEEQPIEEAMKCPPGVVAMVDDRPVTREDADRRATMNVRQSGVKETDPDFEKKVQLAHKGAVDLLIQAYVMQAAATETIEVSTKEIETELLSWKMRVPSKEAWTEFLNGNGLSEDQFKEILAKDLRIRKQMEKAAQREVPTPSPEEAQQFYDVNTMAFAWPYRVRYDEITWLAPPNVSPASREQARKGMDALAMDLARNPALFDEMLAKEVPVTHWGPIGIKQPYVNVKNLPQPITNALQSLVQGEISPVVEIPAGFTLIRIASLSQTYEMAYAEIVQSLYTERCRVNLNDWMDRQKQKHKIRICDPQYYRGGVVASTAETTTSPQR